MRNAFAVRPRAHEGRHGERMWVKASLSAMLSALLGLITTTAVASATVEPAKERAKKPHHHHHHTTAAASRTPAVLQPTAAPVLTTHPVVATAPPISIETSPRSDTPGMPGMDDAIVARPNRLRLTGSHELLLVELDGGVGARQLRFGDGATANLRSHTAPLVPLLGFHAALYPFARGHRRGLEGLGVTADFARSVDAHSSIVGATSQLDDTWLAFNVAVHDRVRITDVASVGLAFGYGQLGYSLGNGDQLVSTMPTVSYRYLRPALDVRLQAGRVLISAGAGYRAVVSGGYTADRFPNGSVLGFDVEAAVQVRLPHDVFVALRGELDQFTYRTHASPGDPVYAPGATDRYPSGMLAVSYMPRL